MQAKIILNCVRYSRIWDFIWLVYSHRWIEIENIRASFPLYDGKEAHIFPYLIHVGEYTNQIESCILEYFTH